MHVSDVLPTPVHDAVEALFLAMGDPVRTPLRTVPGDGGLMEAVGNHRGDYHPIFGLARHFQAHDQGNSGFTKNPYRGDHMSIPVVSEYLDDVGSVFAIDISFHKGITFVERVDFPDAPESIRLALHRLLDKSETR